MLDLSETLSSFPVLMTDRLVLRELTPDDAPGLFRLYVDPRVTQYIGSLPPADLAEAQRRLELRAAGLRAQTAIWWGITLKGDGRLIGTCGHRRLIKEHFRSEVGYDLDPAHWGQGLVPEAVAAILDFGFTRLGLHSVEAQIDPANAGSRRVLEKLGFVQEGYFRESYYLAGQFTDTAVFSLLKAWWLQRQAASG